ncbi:MAG: type II CRISPR RNA-guided endonuclease Cas9 [Lacticaseibacillus songhuajiangensis]|jgi:CRISPR-associated endonuclease Csn1|nr:type II CRISPR RNA-guided endonuclease Cas9 [Lacticaseibacillus songhuajiangensis]
MAKEYGIGLDIGTSSIGYSVVDDNADIIRVKGKRAIGVRLYDEAQKAEERRSFRTSRRRLSRRRWRLNFLREFFDEHIAEVDPGFYERLKYYDESPRDEQAHGLSKALFDYKTNSEFAHEYRTIYHLRHKLMTEHKKFDVREIYLAVHHIVKYRGHFLNTEPVSQFTKREINYGQIAQQISQDFAQVLGDDTFEFSASADDLKRILLAQDLRPSDRSAELRPLFTAVVHPTEDASKKEIKSLEARNKKIATEVSNALSGMQIHMDVLLQIEVEKDAQSEWKTTLATIEDFLALHDADIETEAQYEIIELLRELYADAYLSGEMPHGISAKMLERYEDHAHDLAAYKKLARKQSKGKRDELLGIYSEYINGKESKPVSQDAFFDNVKKALKGIDDPAVEEILSRIELGKFMPKLRSKANTMIPHQMQQIELDRIIENQKVYYPWLAEKNPVAKHLNDQPYKLDELVSFRVPYYVGPMITAKEQKNTSGAEFAWMERKSAGNITPWNFDDKVDRTQSATKFIERMKTTDTYLMGESVLPAASLLYQKFTVLNELNNVRVNGEHLTREQKQYMIRHYFMQKSVVKTTDLVNMLKAESFIPSGSEPDIQGLADPKRFNSKMSTYRDLKRIIPKSIDDSARQADIEKIIEWSTLFEDSKIFTAKLNDITWLTDDQRKKLSVIRYRGWGQLSAVLLTKVKNRQGESILDVLTGTSKNFMQIVHDQDFAEKIEKHNSADYTSADIIADAYTSPSNRKALRQVLAVVEDIERAVGNAPKFVYIEAADGPQKHPQRTTQRQDRLLEAYEQNASILSESVANELKLNTKTKTIFTDKMVLYFSQNGRDAYTGKPIDLNQLNNYDIDHVIPRVFVKDNSFDNRVLTTKFENERKGNNFAIDYCPGQLALWNSWREAGLISERKYRNLTLHERDFNQRANGFIARQLVETRQIIKLAEQVLTAELPEDSAVINIKANLTHDFRDTFDFPKNRDVNDYHHAFDAHLAAFIGTYLRKQFPSYRGLFEYGKFDVLRKSKDTLRRANFIYELENSDRITNGDGELTWNKTADLKKLNEIYEYKTMIVSYATSEYTGALNDQTRWKKSDAKVNGGGKARLVPATKNRPVELYGGYSGSKPAYIAIAKFIKRGEPAFRAIPIYVRNIDELKRARHVSRAAEVKLVEELAAPRFEKVNKKGEITRTPFEIVLPHVQLGTKFVNAKNGVFRLASHTEYRNTVQLWMSKAEMKLLTKPQNAEQWDHYEEPTADKLLRLFDNIIEREYKSNPLMELKINGLKKTRTKFSELPIYNVMDGKKLKTPGMITVLRQIVAALHANANVENLKAIGGTSDFGRVYNPAGIDLDADTTIVTTSASGLFGSTRKI